MSEPKLATPLISFLLAALCVAVVLKVRFSSEWEWLRLFLGFVAFILGIVGIMTLSDWIIHNTSKRLSELERARTYGLVLVANAIKELTPSQVGEVMTLNRAYISILADEQGPIFFVRCLARDVPFVFVEDFLRQSQKSEPYLWPVRESGNKDYAAALTNYIIARGWADKAEGPLAAKLTKPLDWVAGKFGVDLEEE